MCRSLSFSWVVGLLLFLSGISRADDQVQTILAKAIQAHGGKEKLAQFKGGKGKIQGMASNMFNYNTEETNGKFTGEITYLLPDKLKGGVVLDFEALGEPLPFQCKMDFTYNRGKASVQLDVPGMKGLLKQLPNGKKTEEEWNRKTAAFIKTEAETLFRILSLNRLMDACKSKPSEFSVLDEIVVEGKPAVGIKVTSKQQGSFHLYFDKSSGLLVQTIDGRGRDRLIITAHHTLGGLIVPKKMLTKNPKGEKLFEVEWVKLKLLDQVDEKDLALPTGGGRERPQSHP